LSLTDLSGSDIVILLVVPIEHLLPGVLIGKHMAAPLTAYLSQDLRRAVARGETLPDRATGSALFFEAGQKMTLEEAIQLALV
jgi:hypothetical protein